MEKAIDEYFNLEEAEKLRSYLAEVKNMDCEIIEVEDTPINIEVLPFGRLLNSPKDGDVLLKIYEEESYWLPFKVCGYYNISVMSQQYSNLDKMGNK